MPRPKKKVESKSKKKITKKQVVKKEVQIELPQEEKDNLLYIEYIYSIRKAETEEESNKCFENILELLKPRIQKIVSKFNIPGLDTNDVYQESLYALRYKAIKDYDKLRGSGEGLASFERFAVLCIRRHLATEFKSSFQNKKKALNTAASLDQESNGNDEDLSLINIVPAPGGSVVDGLQNNELRRNFLTGLLQSLSGFEKAVFQFYANGDSYEEIAARINKKQPKARVNVKSIDNALSRIKHKAKSLVDQNEEYKSLVPQKRKQMDDIGENDEV